MCGLFVEKNSNELYWGGCITADILTRWNNLGVRDHWLIIIDYLNRLTWMAFWRSLSQQNSCLKSNAHPTGQKLLLGTYLYLSLIRKNFIRSCQTFIEKNEEKPGSTCLKPFFFWLIPSTKLLMCFEKTIRH